MENLESKYEQMSQKLKKTPDITSFFPDNDNNLTAEVTIMSVDEYEAIRLKDYEGFDQERCASRMDISQPTFHRLILSARG